MATITKMQPRPNTYRIDNIILDDYGEKIGAIGIAVYNALARYADRQTGNCYPCIGTIARKLKLGRTTVKKYLRILLKYDLIAITSRWDEQGDPTSNSYFLLDPSPEKVALRRRQLEALLTPQSGTFTLAGGRSPDDLPLCPVATDPQSGADPEQSSTLNKNNGTILSDASPTTPMKSEPTLRQQTCPHPEVEVHRFADGITICYHCYGLLDENFRLVSEEDTPAERVCAA